MCSVWGMMPNVCNKTEGRREPMRFVRSLSPRHRVKALRIVFYISTVSPSFYEILTQESLNFQLFFFSPNSQDYISNYEILTQESLNINIASCFAFFFVAMFHGVSIKLKMLQRYIFTLPASYI